MSGTKQSPAVFLDRDGTLIVDKHYLSKPEQLEFLPNAIPGLKHFQSLGFKFIVVTNQSGIARGYFTPDDLASVHVALLAMANEAGTPIEAIYHCPHGPDSTCTCRKPATGMIEQAAREHHVDIKRSIMIGDKPADVELGHRLGMKSILTLQGYGQQSQTELNQPADYIARDLLDAAQWFDKQSA